MGQANCFSNQLVLARWFGELAPNPCPATVFFTAPFYCLALNIARFKERLRLLTTAERLCSKARNLPCPPVSPGQVRLGGRRGRPDFMGGQREKRIFQLPGRAALLAQFLAGAQGD
jgi:hypothetical protein